MKKNIQIILKKTMPKLGQEGEAINVAPGYAFNYLIPNRIASLATKGTLKHVNMLAEIQNQKKEIIKIKATELQEQFKKITKISIKKKTGDKQYIFGNISSKEITEKIFKYIGIKLDKKQIEAPEIKKIGTYIIKIHILDDIIANIKLQILPANI
uniref:50S ribosomal protein L9, chloroplastic n=1 Tax=Phyllymenia taiwanensis TaxID=1260292 RepID=R9XWL9_9FLOR|nr:50S ribosomal protein L9 [Grateloupia taiwanensis]AGO19872.1 50S ribosomal protein L9 [Grateloupia taiwanensis]